MSTTSLLRSAALFRAALLCGLLAACGGGGGDAPTGPGPIEPPAPPPAGAPPAPAPALASFAYLLQSDKIEVCQIDSGDLLTNCVTTGGFSVYQDLSAMAVEGAHAYIANISALNPATILHCDMDATTGALSGCSETGPSNLLEPYGLTIHGSTLYIGDSGSPRLHKCEINPDGSLQACVAAGVPDGLASGVRGLQFVDTTAYLLHYDEGKVSRCEVLDDGSMSGCIDAGATGLADPVGFTINGDHMYFANRAHDNVIRCIIADDGLLGGCEDAGAPGLNSPTQVATRGSSVYISNRDAGIGVTRCSAASNGLLTDCAPILTDPRFLFGIHLR